MTALNLFHKVKYWLLLGLTLSASVSYGAIKYIDLTTSEVFVDKPPAIPQGGVIAIKVHPQSKVSFNGKPVYLGSDGIAVLALHRDDTAAELMVENTNGETETVMLEVLKRQYQIERIDGLPPAKVTAPPDPKIQQQIRREAAEIRKVRQLIDDRTDFMAGFIWPVKGRISGVYGSQRVLNGKPRTPHYGVDIAIATGTPVIAPAAGIVIYVNNDMYYSGGTLVIDHGHGLSSAFLHLSSIDVAVGDRVEQAQQVGQVGATGRATGPHLDWRMNWGANIRIDPQLLVQPMPQ